MLGVHATLHDVTVAIVVVGIVACVVRIVVIVVIKTGAKESTGKEPSPMVEAAMESYHASRAIRRTRAAARKMSTRIAEDLNSISPAFEFEGDAIVGYWHVETCRPGQMSVYQGRPEVARRRSKRR